MKQTEKARFGYILSIVLAGTIGVFVRGITLPSGVIAMSRGYLGCVFLILISCLRGHRIDLKRIRKSLPALFVSGAVLGINWIFLFESYRYTTVATATLCYYLAPVLVVLTSPLFLGEKLTPIKLICVGAAFIGMVFVSGVAEHGLPQLAEMRGVLCALAAAVFYAAMMIMNKRIHGVSSYDRAIIQLGTAGIVLVPYCLLTAGISTEELQAKSLLLLLVVGIIHTGVIYLLYFGAMDHLSGQSISMLGYLDPIIAVLCSVLILRENFSIYSLIGSVLVLGAAVVSEIPWKRKGKESVILFDEPKTAGETR